MTDTTGDVDLTVAASNPILSDAVIYYADRRAMANPKGWAHVVRVVERAIGSGVYAQATADQVETARSVLAVLVKSEQTT